MELFVNLKWEKANQYFAPVNRGMKKELKGVIKKLSFFTG